MTRSNHELDRLRDGRTELENHYIDELVAGRLNRRDFLRRGTALGMSVPLLGAILAACGSSGKSTTGSTAPSGGTAKAGGTLRVAITAPTGAVNPLTLFDPGGLCMLNQTGEFLIFDNNLQLTLQPMLHSALWRPVQRWLSHDRR
jgi:peptide/nickel transport system substrate-binding protein